MSTQVFWAGHRYVPILGPGSPSGPEIALLLLLAHENRRREHRYQVSAVEY